VGVSSLQRQARVEIQRGDFGAALETLTKLRQLADGEDDPRIASMLAHCYLQLGRAGDAIETLTEAIATAPDQFSLQLNLAKSILVGVTQGAEGATLAGALSAIGRALQLRPESSDAWSTQGRILQAADRPDDALISYEKATQTDPQDAAPRVLSAHLHQSRADWAAVRLTLAPLVETQTQPTALLLAARAEVELGNLKGARSLVSRFGEEFSSLSDEELAEKIRRLSGETPASPPTTSHETNAPDPA
jgi:Flp pilus assembly protein TadD